MSATPTDLARSVSSQGRDFTTALPLSEWLRPVLALPLIEIEIDATIRRQVTLGSPACAVVRGRLGQRLREFRCRTGSPTCDGCPVAVDCDYAKTFDVGSPHPFWFQGVPATMDFEPSAQVTVRMYLAKPAQPIAQYLDVTLRDAVRAIDPEATLSPSRWRHATLGEFATPLPDGGPIHLRTESPLCLRGDLDLCRKLCPHVPWLALLARAGVRRLDALVRAFAPPAGGMLPRAELPDLAKVRVIGGALRPWTSTRFSHRQHQRIPLDGLHGDAVLHGAHLDELAPLLAALAVTNVGKATSFGLGALRLVPS